MDKKEKEKRKRARNIRKIRKDSPRNKLRALWDKHKQSFGARKLIYIAKEIDDPETQKSALEEFLTKPNLTFADFYRALGLPKEVLELDPELENKIWEGCFDIVTPDNLRELLHVGEERAAKELFQRIDKGAISPPKSKQILISEFEMTGDERIKEECWKRIEKIGPNEDELKYLLDLDETSKLHRYIERLLAKRAQRKTEKTITEIKKLVAQIKQRQE